MALTMHAASAPLFGRMLNNLSGLLDKAAAHATDKKIDEAVLVGARLYPNMLPLTKQVQIACDTAKRCIARLSDVEAPVHDDSEQTLAELQRRIADTIAFIKSVDADKVNGTEGKPITLELPGNTINFVGQEYLFGFAIPNFMFHVSIAHAILRHNGVEIGKRDFLGG